MSNIELKTFWNGNITIIDRAIRVIFGLTVLVGALYAPVDNTIAYPLVKVIAATVVLTGIAGWDPFYAMFQKLVEQIKNASIGQSKLEAS